MTRFARAKGSKSSNERVPDEATPWSVMKMQLEDSQASSKVVTKKVKSAKELLAEKDELFYHNTLGNVNHEWAVFDEVLDNRSSKDTDEKLHKIKSGKKDRKKIEKADEVYVSNNNSNAVEMIQKKEGKVEDKNQNNDQTNEKLQTFKTIDEFQSLTKKRKKSIANEDGSELDSQKFVEHENMDEIGANNPNVDLDTNDTLANDKSDSKNKKRAKKSKKLKSSLDSIQIADKLENVKLESLPSQSHEVTTVDSTKESLSPSVDEKLEKLTKRQKRNKKKQEKIISDQHENKIIVDKGSQKEQNSVGFNVVGNDWNNEVKFGKQSNSVQLSAAANTDTGVDERQNFRNRKEKLKKRNINVEKESEGEKVLNDNSISDNSNTEKINNTQNKKSQKRKGGKNDNKEYKRRKPDEGVVKMIINDNEIEVIKYDGFPVKKEDADRLHDLKKNMIIKGIPRSEIAIAMKLERRKAEKALARERKRVCFHCRKSGHNLSDCPELGRDESATGICFKCGSAEHTHFECRVVKGQEFRHASCFICREQGHIAKQCPDNPKGLYPQGGACKICGDVTHLKKDCPDLIQEKEETNITADKIIGSQLESLQEDETNTKRENANNKPRNKIIKF